jgi:carbonic anhydrase
MSSSLSRRRLFHTVACGCAALPASLLVEPARAQSAAKTAYTADQALAMLKEGNAAFRQGGACVSTGGPARVAELARGQSPFAVVVSCADSRTPPEHLFGRGLGELFVVRVAGNTVDTGALGSIEFSVAVLGSPLVVVLGHTRCGAVEAATKIVTENAKFPGAIGEMVEPIVPAVLRAQKACGALLDSSIRENVRGVIARLETASAILADARRAGSSRLREASTTWRAGPSIS